MDAIQIVDGYIQHKHGTAAEWASENPVLLAWEIGLETDTQLAKMGDGITAWNNLPYAFAGAAITITTGSANGTIAVDGTDVAVKGLGSMAFDSGSYLSLSGGTMTGAITRKTVLAQNAVNNSYIAIYGGSSSTAGGRIGLRGSTYSTDPGSFLLNASNGTTQKALLGKPDGTLTWDGQAIQISSDKRLKTEFSDIPETVLKAWGKIKWQQFKYIEDVNNKGSGNCRFHVGLIAQDVKEVGDTEGVDLLDYGILCKGDFWSIRYAEALSLEASYQRRRAEQLEKRIEALERIVKDKGGI